MYYLETLRAPIPENSQVTKAGLVQYKTSLPYGKGSEKQWTPIGKLPPEGEVYDEEDNQLMVPNNIYAFWLSNLYSSVAGKDPDNIAPFFRQGAIIGPFALFLGAVTKSGLYDILIDVFGVETANALLDIAMLYNTDESLEQHLPFYRYDDQIVFSVRPHTKAWYQERVNAITDDEIDAFMERWSKRRQRSAHQDTAIHLCASTEPVSRDMFWEGEAWSAFTVCEMGGDYPGLPLAYHFCYSGDPDEADALIAQIVFQDIGLKPKYFMGGFSPLKPPFFTMAEKLRLPWLLKLKDTFLAYEDILARHEEELFQGHGTPVSGRESMVAVQEKDVLLFGPDTLDPDRRSCVSLYCITKEAKESRDFLQKCLDQAYPEACAMLDKLQNSEEKDTLPIPDPNAKPAEDEDDDENTVEEQALRVLYRAVCKAGGQFYSPEPHAWQCFKMEYHPEESRYHLEIDEGEVRYHRSRGNYIAMASSEPMDLQVIADSFPLAPFLADSMFAPAFSAMHKQLNNPPPEFDDISNWFFVAFISDIVRALLLPALRAFEAEKDGELRAKAMEEYTEEERKGKEPNVFISIGDMLQWLEDVRFSFYNARDPYLAYDGNTSGVRGDVLRAVGVPLYTLPLFLDLLHASVDPKALRSLRQEKRTLPRRHNRPKQGTGKD